MLLECSLVKGHFAILCVLPRRQQKVSIENRSHLSNQKQSPIHDMCTWKPVYVSNVQYLSMINFLWWYNLHDIKNIVRFIFVGIYNNGSEIMFTFNLFLKRNKCWHLLYLIQTTFLIELSLKVFMSFMKNHLRKCIRKRVYLFSLIRLCKQIFLKNVSDNGFVVIHTLCSTYIGYMSAHLVPVFLENSNPCKYFPTR